MKKLDIYIIKKFLGTFFLSIALLILIVIVFDISEKIDDFIEREAPIRAIIFDYYLNFIPYFANLFSYLFTFIAVVYFTSKMSSHNEITPILISGISFKRFLLPYILTSVFLAALSFYLSNFLIPHTNKALISFEKIYIKNPIINKDRNIHMQINPGTFVYVQSYNTFKKLGYKFALEKTDKTKGLYYKLTSDYIKWDSTSGKWKLKNYFIRTIEGLNEKITRGKQMSIALNLHPSDFLTNIENIKTMNYSQLRKFIKKEKMKGSKNVIEYEVEKHKRIADPFSTIILTLIAVSLSSRKLRGGIGLHLAIGITIAFAFLLFMQVSKVYATCGNLSPFIAVWTPNILFGLISIFLLKVAPK